MKIAGIPRIRKPAYPKAKSPSAPKPPPLPQAEAPTADMDPDALRAYYDLKNCGDPAERKRIAERYSSLKKEVFSAITLPEAIYYDGLEQRGVTFDYQSPLQGGRTELGGMVSDFLVEINAGIWYSVLVNGDYWHSSAVQKERDFEARERITGMVFSGGIVIQVLEVWESRLLDCLRDNTIEQSLLGIEMGPL